MTQLSFQIFLMLRFYIPELNRYGRDCFLCNCKKKYVGKIYNNTITTNGILIVLKQPKVININRITCEGIYNNGDETDYKYYPSNFCQQMYDWMVKHKGEYKLHNTDKTYYPF